jgi:hypothetical protein
VAKILVNATHANEDFTAANVVEYMASGASTLSF